MDITVMEMRETVVGTPVETVLSVHSAESRTDRNGKLYWNLKLGDRTGSIDARVWSPLAEACGEVSVGSFVRISGRTGVYGGSVQLTVERIDVLTDADAAGIDLSRFMQVSVRSGEEMMGSLERLLKDTLTYGPWWDFCRRVLRDGAVRGAFMTAPGAVAMHHAYQGGLLEHTLAVCGNCMDFAGRYPQLDRQVLLVAAAFHDIGKIREYELAGLTAPRRTSEGALVGHIVLGLEMLAPFLAKSSLDDGLKEHLRHLITSHHGRLEYGSPVVPMTAEAFALNFADDLDAKMNQIEGKLGEGIGEGGWTQWIRPLDRALMRTVRTPGGEDGGEDAETGMRQCSLL